MIRRWVGPLNPSRFLKTDLFEEAGNGDRLMFDLLPQATAIGMDVAPSIVRRASTREPGADCRFLVCDVRQLALASGSLDLVLSTSTLDHFDCVEDVRKALNELVRVLRPGGMLIVTLDNPLNPIYSVLRMVCRTRMAPFKLGVTLSARDLSSELMRMGLDVEDASLLIHNPRLLSTLVFLVLRRLLGRYADRPIACLLAVFAAAGRLPTRRYTACFNAVCARKLAVPSACVES
ncbi:MAG: class I SAM-dependent methyltransferase [Acidobacteria bacterium]|nr:class I SAM-dependent methyltransferase [Acidobacteriota bacterium]